MRSINLAVLCLCQLVSVSGSVLVVTVGGLVGMELATDPRIATLPLSIMIVGTALSTVAAALLMQRYGRRLGFAFGALLAAAGALLAAGGLEAKSFVVFCAGIACIGIQNAFVQQYRFAAAESVAVRHAGRAISLILLGAIGGGFFGPVLATQTALTIGSHALSGGFVALASLYGVAALLLGGLRGLGKPAKDGTKGTGRRLATIATQPHFVTAVMSGAVGYAAMNLIMTATPLSMHVGDGHSMEDTAWVIRSHVIAMYAPSLFSGFLIESFGSARIMAVGVTLMLATLGFGLLGHQVMHYWWALVLLGIAWNFLYVGGTAHLIDTYRPEERFKAQAVNEFTVIRRIGVGIASGGHGLRHIRLDDGVAGHAAAGGRDGVCVDRVAARRCDAMSRQLSSCHTLRSTSNGASVSPVLGPNIMVARRSAS